MKRALVFLAVVVGYCCATSFAVDHESDLSSSQGVRLLHSDESGAGWLRSGKQVQIYSEAGQYNPLSHRHGWAPKNVNFEKNQLLLIRMGLKPSAGYGVRIGKVETLSDRTYIHIIYSRPGAECSDAAVMTNPMKLFLVPTKNDILIREHLQVIHCEELWRNLLFNWPAK